MKERILVLFCSVQPVEDNTKSGAIFSVVPFETLKEIHFVRQRRRERTLVVVRGGLQVQKSVKLCTYFAMEIG